MTAKRISLETWATLTYGKAPHPNTLRRWAREGHIYPKPEKHGRSYYVVPHARYIDPKKPPRDLVAPPDREEEALAR
jgi:hypothetical protein